MKSWGGKFKVKKVGGRLVDESTNDVGKMRHRVVTGDGRKNRVKDFHINKTELGYANRGISVHGKVH